MVAKLSSKVLIAVSGAIATIVVLAGCVSGNQSSPHVTAQPSTASAVGTATATPTPTAAAVPTQFPANTPLPEPTASSVEPVIVVAGLDIGGATVSASGYVAGIIENNGTCTFLFTNGQSNVTLTSSGISDVRTTSCGLVEAPASRFSSGSWGVTLTYLSLAGETTVSQSSAVEIP